MLLTDEEERIFRAAMSREEEVCRKVEEEGAKTGTKGEVDLLAICRSIRKKAKADEPYKWHDLRKNPKDLPLHKSRVIFYTVDFERPEYEKRYWTGLFFKYDFDNSSENFFYNDDYEGRETRNEYYSHDVIAWRYIEPFKEEEK